MSLRITEISVKNLGPIKEFNLQPKLVNCIYGENESGKTFLVEFIIKCLFKERKFLKDLREINGEGKIKMLIEDKEIEFILTPGLGRRKKIQKLEDLLKEKFSLFTPSLVRIFIIKSGEVGIEGVEEKERKDEILSKNILKEIFPLRKILDMVAKNIPSSIQNASIEENIIKIARQGEGDRYYKLKEDCEKLAEGIREIIEKYNPGKIKELQRTIENLEEKKENLLKAKRYKAYTLFCEIENLKKEINELPDDKKIEEVEKEIDNYNHLVRDIEKLESRSKKLKEEINSLMSYKEKYEKQLKAKRYKAYQISYEIRRLEKELEKFSQDKLNLLSANLARLRSKKEDYEKKKKEADEKSNCVKHLKWLREASKKYSEFLKEPPRKIPKDILLFIGNFLLAIFLFLSFLFKSEFLKYLIGLLGVCGFILWNIYVYKLKKAFKDFAKNNEIEGIKKEYSERFNNEELYNQADLETKLKLAEEAEIFINSLRLDELKKEYESLIEMTKNNFRNLTNEEIEEDQFEEKLQELQKVKEEKETEINNLRINLLKLNVDEKDYETNNPQVEFNQDEFEEINKKICELNKKEEEYSKNKGEVEKLRDEIDTYRTRIKKWFEDNLHETIDDKNWEKKISELKKTKKNIEEEIKNKEGELKGLEIDSSDFLNKDPGIQYSKNELNEVEKEIKNLNSQLQEIEKNLNGLKGKISNLVNKEITVDWSELLEDLYQLKKHKESEFKDIEARIIAGKLVYETITELQKEEDESLQKYLNSEEVKDTIKNITRKYKEFKVEDKNILISDDFSDFRIEELSTGAKEQVLIGIRIGLIKKLFNTDSGFLIFDDAFQHVDWKKRPILLDTLVELAVKNKWQILIFTMDDNIKDLFEKKTKEKLDKEEIIIYRLESV